MTRLTLTLFIALAFSFGSPIAQQTGQIDYPQLGLSFTIPDGWVGQEAEGLYLMGHNSIPGFIFVIPHEQSLTTAQMQAEAAAGLFLGAGSQLAPTGSVDVIGRGRVGGEFQGSIEYSPAQAYIIGLENVHGNGLTVIALTSPQAFETARYRGFAEAVANSVQFSAIETTTTAEPSGAARGTLEDWRYQLGGTKLTFMESYYSGSDMGGGYNMESEIHLCQAGYFLYYDQSVMSAGNASSNVYSGGNSRGHGNWEVIEQAGTFYLILNFQDGNRHEYELAWGEDSKLFLNGTRFYRTWTGEYAPNCE